MEGKTFIFVVLSGLCFLPVCSPLTYIRVDEAKSWGEARSHCREKYTDLASVNNEEELKQLVEVAEIFNFRLWIGLYDDVNSWQWSLEKEGYYDFGGADFRMWGAGEPNNVGGHQNCARMSDNGKWADVVCETTDKFVCYNASGASSFIYVEEARMWTDAQRYCRTYHTDLASVRTTAENEKIHAIGRNKQMWIGLYRDSWKWSDGRPNSFPNWKHDDSKVSVKPCGLLCGDKWEASTCDEELFFLCYVVSAKQKVVKVKVTKKDPSLNLEDAAEAILQQFSQTVKDHGLIEDTKLTWRKQPDGKIFYLEKRD